MIRTKTIILVMAMAVPVTCLGQKWAVSTNLADYANLLTLNGELSFSVHKHYTISISGKYNPFVFNSGQGPEKQLQNKTVTAAVGTRYWPFFVYSGFYFGAKLQWNMYNTGGVISERTFEGKAFGAGLNAGYSLLVTSHLNIEFGIGAWTGWTDYKEYDAPGCGKLTYEGGKWFVFPDELRVGLLFNF